MQDAQIIPAQNIAVFKLNAKMFSKPREFFRLRGNGIIFGPQFRRHPDFETGLRVVSHEMHHFGAILNFSQESELAGRGLFFLCLRAGYIRGNADHFIRTAAQWRSNGGNQG